PPAAPGCAASTGSSSKNSASPWRCPSAPAANSAAPQTTTASCLTRCTAPRHKPAPSSPHTCTPAPPSCDGCSTGTPSGNNAPTAKKESQPMPDHSSGRPWDPIVAPWHLDEHIPAFPVPAGVTETICPALPAGPVGGRMNLLHQAVADAVARANRPLLLTGDCPTARAAVAGLQRRHRDLAVVWLDAHGDFNTPAITASGYLGGMALAMLTGRTPGLFGDALGLRPVAETSLVLADPTDPHHPRPPPPPRPTPPRAHPRPARDRPHAGLPAPRHRCHRQRATARPALPLRLRPLPHPDRGMLGRHLRHRRRDSRLHRLRLATRPRQRPGHTRDNHPARPSTRHRPGMARTRRPLTAQPDPLAAPATPPPLAVAQPATSLINHSLHTSCTLKRAHRQHDHHGRRSAASSPQGRRHGKRGSRHQPAGTYRRPDGAGARRAGGTGGHPLGGRPSPVPPGGMRPRGTVGAGRLRGRRLRRCLACGDVGREPGPARTPALGGPRPAA